MLNSQRGLLCQLQAHLSIPYMVMMGPEHCKPQLLGGSCVLLDSANEGCQAGPGRRVEKGRTCFFL